MIKVKDLYDIRALINRVERVEEAINKQEFNLLTSHPGLVFNKESGREPEIEVHKAVVKALREYRKVLIAQLKELGLSVSEAEA